jgi:type I restriction enzyme, S subunit
VIATTTIEDACDLVTDGTHYTPRDADQGIPFLTVKDVTDGALDFLGCSFISDVDYQAAHAGNSAPERGDVLFSKDGTVGKVHVVDTDRPFAVLSSLAILRPKRDAVDPRYFGHVLRSPSVLNDAMKRKTGSAIRRVILSDLKNVRIPLPLLPEQRRIAEILDKAEAMRAKRRTALAQLDTLAQSIFLDMFGDPATNPKEWPIVKLGELIAVGPQNGLYRPANDYGTGTPIVRIDAFYDGFVTGLATLKRVRISSDEIALYGLQPGEIVVNRVNSREYLGKSALIPELSEPTVFESNMMRFGIDRTRLHPVYLIQLLQTRHIRSHILRAAKDAVNQSSINQQDVKDMPVPVTPLPSKRFLPVAYAQHRCLLTSIAFPVCISTHCSRPFNTAPLGGSCSHARRVHRCVVGDLAGGLAAADR